MDERNPCRRENPVIKVFIDDEEDPRTDIVLLKLSSGCCGQPDIATFEVLDTGRSANTLDIINITTHSSVSVCIDDIFVHFGKLVRSQVKVDSSKESAVFTSRFEKHLISDRLRGTLMVRDPDAESRESASPSSDSDDEDSMVMPTAIEVVGRTPTFNPLFDGEIVPNRFEFPNGIAIAAPQQTFVPPGQTLDERFKRWTVAEVVFYLCHLLNPNQRYLNNPNIDELTEGFGESRDIVRNFSVSIGTYLDDALNALLVPLGYGWFIHHESRTRRVLRFYNPVSVEMPTPLPGRPTVTPPDQLEIPFEDQFDFDAATDLISNSANKITVIGSRRQIETTIELTPDWDPEKEGEPINAYRIGNPDWKDDPELRNVFRRWTIASKQGGDELTSRAKLDADQFEILARGSEPFYLRRQFLPCITKNEDGRPFGNFSGCFIEYSTDEDPEPPENPDPDTPPATANWYPIEGTDKLNGLKNGRSVEIIKDQLGIYFNGPFPPTKIQEIGTETIRFRITGVIEMDNRIFVERERDDSVLNDVLESIVSIPSAFPFRSATGSVLTDRPDATFTEIDSTEEMEKFADDILERQGLNQTDGSLALIGLRPDMRENIGFKLTKIGQNTVAIYNGASPPLIERWEADITSQTTVLSLGNPS